jgi:hypothetical protein
MPTLSVLWESVNDFIAIQGTNGASLSTVFESLKIPLNLQRTFVNRLFVGGKCKFYRSESTSTGDTIKTLMNHQELRSNPPIADEKIFCVADVAMSWKAYGFESYHDIPDSQTPLLLSVLEILGMAREKGCSNTEISLLLGIPKLHTVVERIVSLGYVIKRIGLPLNGKGATCRVKSRTVLLHLKRFAAQYDPTPDDIEIEADENMRVDINYYFTKLLNFHNIQEIAATDAAQAIGIGPKKLIKLKDSFASYVKAGLAGICFIDRDVPLIYPGRQPGSRMRSCLGFVASPIALKVATDHDVAINAPVYEQSTAMLRWSSGEGISSTILRVKLCLYAKRAARVSVELNTVHGYPMKKQQAGKTQVNQLYDIPNVQLKKKPINRYRIDDAVELHRYLLVAEENTELETAMEEALQDEETAVVPSLLPLPFAAVSDAEASASATKKPDTDLRTTRIKCIFDTLKKVLFVNANMNISYVDYVGVTASVRSLPYVYLLIYADVDIIFILSSGTIVRAFLRTIRLFPVGWWRD